ncbi:ArsR/SmtB family transcription factor [Ferrimicrobium acidiphilum]|uniref:Putative HTH-type transcriptional regulator n=1 Tax=Ferrimicrobium acidiphilum DSM 19497 TaxID=1121877 RepID=A0A0D8FS46_9ACTN|nr:metalloregulator ArsR/SmtB family transcription factor [Ferrimicrobium acidiphilum]KJE76095.1 putative HTH-type transcriptional regulator [Ferrimicrobium acidiphilum DSM 19497]
MSTSATSHATPLYELKADFFKSMGHPIRIRILELLSNGPLNVGELKAQIEVNAPHLSQQLNVLKREGLVTSARSEKNVVYALAFEELIELLAVARRILIDVLAKQSDLLVDLQTSLPSPDSMPGPVRETLD